MDAQDFRSEISVGGFCLMVPEWHNEGRVQIYLLVPGIKAVHKLAIQFRIHNSLFPPLKLRIIDNKLIINLHFSFVFVIFFPLRLVFTSLHFASSLLLLRHFFFPKKKGKTELFKQRQKKNRICRSVKINLTPLILWSQRIFANRSLSHFCRRCKTMTNHLRGEKRKTISRFCTFKHPWTLLICFVLWILTLHFAKTGAGMRWWMIETPPPSLSPPPPPSPIFIPLYDGNTISSDRHWLRVEFFSPGAAMAWLRSQPPLWKNNQTENWTAVTICNNRLV